MRSVDICSTALTQHTLPDGQRGFRIKLTASSAVDMPDEIFVHRIKGTLHDFSHVASPADLEEFQVELMPGTGYYRSSEVEFVSRSFDELQALLVDVYTDIGRLIESLNEMDALSASSVVIEGE